MKNSLFILILILFCIPAFAKNAAAEFLPEIQIEEQYRFATAILPNSIPVYLYKDLPVETIIDVAKLKNALSIQIQNNPYFILISQNDIDNAIKNADFNRTDALMQAELNMGYAKNLMNDMNFSTAIDLTRNVIDNYQKALMQYLQPQTVAPAYQQLAYAIIGKYLENPESQYELLHPARLAFMELIRTAPYLSMIKGRQSKERVSLYNEALELFLSSAAYRQIPENDAETLARQINANILIFPRIIQDKSGSLYLEIDQYLANSKQMRHLNKKLDFPKNIPHNEYIENIATWMLADSYSCTDTHDKIVAQNDDDNDSLKLYFNLGLSYSSFFRHPTEDMLNNIGGHVFLSIMLDKYFFIRTGIEFFEVLQDKAHELYNNFEVYQFPVVFGIIKNWTYVDLFIAIGLDFSFSSSFISTTSTTCKTFGLNDIECSPNDVIDNRDPFSLMLDTIIGVSFGANPFRVSIEGFFNPTLYPSGNKAFRHQLGARLSLQYAF